MTTEIVRREPTASLPEKMEWARALASSNLLPRQYQNNPGNLLFAVEYADALGVSRINAITSIHVIEGKPSASADLIASLVRRAGHKLRLLGDDTYAEAQLIRIDDPEFTYTARWDLDKAKAAGLLGKGVWKSYPGAMLRSRAITEVARMGASDALFGVIYSPEELGAEVDPDGEVVHTITNASAGAGADRARQALGVSPTPEPEADAEAAATTPDGITAAQIRKLGVAMKEAGLTDRDNALAYVAGVIGRTVESRNDLTKAEASQVIDALEGGDDAVDAELVETPSGSNELDADAVWNSIAETGDQLGWQPEQLAEDFKNRMGMIPDEAAAPELQAYLELIQAEVPAA